MKPTYVKELGLNKIKVGLIIKKEIKILGFSSIRSETKN
jgi:hypothetical protein